MQAGARNRTNTTATTQLALAGAYLLRSWPGPGFSEAAELSAPRFWKRRRKTCVNSNQV